MHGSGHFVKNGSKVKQKVYHKSSVSSDNGRARDPSWYYNPRALRIMCVWVAGLI